MLEVAIGSSADAGSSSSSTSGSTARARAMQRRCCWPPESERALRFSRSLTSSHSAADLTAFFSLEIVDGTRSGVLVEYDLTEKIFTNPGDKRTEDYVTGRFG